MLVLTLRTHDIMIFGGMNGKLRWKNTSWKWILCAKGENDEMDTPNSRDRLRLKNMGEELLEKNILKLILNAE